MLLSNSVAQLRFLGGAYELLSWDELEDAALIPASISESCFFSSEYLKVWDLRGNRIFCVLVKKLAS